MLTHTWYLVVSLMKADHASDDQLLSHQKTENLSLSVMQFYDLLRIVRADLFYASTKSRTEFRDNNYQTT